MFGIGNVKAQEKLMEPVAVFSAVFLEKYNSEESVEYWRGEKGDGIIVIHFSVEKEQPKKRGRPRKQASSQDPQLSKRLKPEIVA